MGVLVGSYPQSADHIHVESDYEKSRWEDVFITVFVFFSPPSCSLHSPLSKVPDLEGRGGLDLPHPAGSRHGPGQLGGGLLHRHLPARWVIEEGQKGRRNKVLGEFFLENTDGTDGGVLGLSWSQHCATPRVFDPSSPTTPIHNWSFQLSGRGLRKISLIK